MSIQTLYDRARASSTYRHQAVRRHENEGQSRSERDCTASTGDRAPHPRRSDAEGTFARAVFATFLSLSVPGTRTDGDAAQTASASTKSADTSVVRYRESLKIALDVQDDGDVELSLQVKAKVKITGDAASSGDMMPAMQAFAANLFGALRDLFEGLSGKPAAQPAQPASPAVPAGSPSAASAPAPAAAAESVQPAAADTAVTVVEAPPAPSTNVRWIGSYLSMETRVRMLAQQADRTDNAERGSGAVADEGALASLRHQFDDIAGQLQGDLNQGLPTLGTFLRALAAGMEGERPASFSFAVSLRGSFVSTSA